jgi:WD40 repeat protein
MWLLMGRNSCLKKFIVFIIILAFSFQTTGSCAQAIPLPTSLPVASSFSFIRGLKIHPDHPFEMDFIVADHAPAEFGLPYDQLIHKTGRYFLASLSMPEEDLWVNLSPYEKDRIIPSAFGLTEMGRDLLDQDYLLKQHSAILLDPDTGTGKSYWSQVYSHAMTMFGTTDIPLDGFNKVWIVPGTARVFEKNGHVLVTEAKLRVLLDTDYMALKHHQSLESVSSQDISREALRKYILPVIEEKVNTDPAFAPVREIFRAHILGTYFRKKLRDGLFQKEYIDQKKVAGIDLSTPGETAAIYARYLVSARKGAVNLIREERDKHSGELIPRKYFSGGASLAGVDLVLAGKEELARTIGQFDASAIARIHLKDSAQGPEIKTEPLRYELAEPDRAWVEKTLKVPNTLVVADQPFMADSLHAALLTYGRETGQKFIRVALQDENDISRLKRELLATSSGDYRIVDGPLAEIITNGGILLIDYNGSDPVQAERLNSLLDAVRSFEGLRTVSPGLRIVGVMSATGIRQYTGAARERLSETSAPLQPLGEEFTTSHITSGEAERLISEGALTVDFFEMPEWQAILTGEVRATAQGGEVKFEVIEGALLNAQKQGKPLIIRGPLKNDPRLERFLLDVSLRGSVRLNGEERDVSGVKIHVQDFDYTSSATKKIQSAGVVFAGQAEYIHAWNQNTLITRSRIDKDGNYISGAGLLSSSDPLLIRVAGNIDRWAWHKLLHAPDHILVEVMPGVEVPFGYQRLVEGPRTSPGPSKSLGGLDEMPGDPFHSAVVTGQNGKLEAILDGVESRYADALMVPVLPQNSLAGLLGYTPKTGEWQFKAEGTEVLEALRSGKTVIFHMPHDNPQFLDEAASMLAKEGYIVFNGERIPVKGKVIIVAPLAVAERMNVEALVTVDHQVTQELTEDLRRRLNLDKSGEGATQEEQLQKAQDKVRAQFFVGGPGTGKSRLAREIGQDAFPPVFGPVTVGQGVEESTLVAHSAVGAAGVSETVYGVIGEWARSKSGGTLIVDETDTARPGFWSLLRGAFSKRPHIWVMGKRVALTDRHKIIFTGNGIGPGRHMPAMADELMLVQKFSPLDRSKKREIMARENYVHTVDRPEMLMDAILDLDEIFAKAAADRANFSLRDIQAVAQQMNMYHPNGWTNGDVVLAAWEIYKGIFTPDELEGLQRVLAGKFGVDIRGLDVRAMDNAWVKHDDLVATRPARTIVRAMVRLKDTLQFRKTHSTAVLDGKRLVILQGGSGIAKDYAAPFVWDENELIRETATPSNVDVIRARIREAKDDGKVLVISEANHLPSAFLEGELNDLLTSQGDYQEGFGVILTINDRSFNGREKFSSGLLNRAVYEHVEDLDESDLRLMLEYYTRRAGQPLGPADEDYVVRAHMWLRDHISAPQHKPTQRRLQHLAERLEYGEPLEAAVRAVYDGAGSRGLTHGKPLPLREELVSPILKERDPVRVMTAMALALLPPGARLKIEIISESAKYDGDHRFSPDGSHVIGIKLSRLKGDWEKTVWHETSHGRWTTQEGRSALSSNFHIEELYQDLEDIRHLALSRKDHPYVKEYQEQPHQPLAARMSPRDRFRVLLGQYAYERIRLSREQIPVWEQSLGLRSGALETAYGLVDQLLAQSETRDRFPEQLQTEGLAIMAGVGKIYTDIPKRESARKTREEALDTLPANDEILGQVDLDFDPRAYASRAVAGAPVQEISLSPPPLEEGPTQEERGLQEAMNRLKELSEASSLPEDELHQDLRDVARDLRSLGKKNTQAGHLASLIDRKVKKESGKGIWGRRLAKGVAAAVAGGAVIWAGRNYQEIGAGLWDMGRSLVEGIRSLGDSWEAQTTREIGSTVVDGGRSLVDSGSGHISSLSWSDAHTWAMIGGIAVAAGVAAWAITGLVKYRRAKESEPDIDPVDLPPDVIADDRLSRLLDIADEDRERVRGIHSEEEGRGVVRQTFEREERSPQGMAVIEPVALDPGAMEEEFRGILDGFYETRLFLGQRYGPAPGAVDFLRLMEDPDQAFLKGMAGRQVDPERRKAVFITGDENPLGRSAVSFFQSRGIQVFRLNEQFGLADLERTWNPSDYVVFDLNAQRQQIEERMLAAAVRTELEGQKTGLNNEILTLPEIKVVHQLSGAGLVKGMAVQGNIAITVGDSGIHVWDLVTGQRTGSLIGHSDRVYRVFLTPDGQKAITTGGNREIFVWDLASRSVTLKISSSVEFAYGEALSPDGRTLLVTGMMGRKVFIYDIVTGKRTGELDGHTGSVYGAAFTPDGRAAITTGQGGEVFVWDISARTMTSVLVGHVGTVFRVAVTPDGKSAITTSADGEVFIWDIATGRRTGALSGHGSITSGTGGSAGQAGKMEGLAISPDGRTVVTSSEVGEVFVWDLATGQRIRSLSGHTHPGRVAFTSDGTRVLIAEYADAHDPYLWSLARPVADAPQVNMPAVSGIQFLPSQDIKPVHNLQGHNFGIRWVSVTKDGTRGVSIDNDGKIIVWDMTTGIKIHENIKLLNRIRQSSVAVAPDGGYLFVTDGNEIVLADLETGTEVSRFTGHARDVMSVMIAPDNRIAVSGEFEEAIIWEIDTRKILHRLPHKAVVTDIAISPDGSKVVTSSSKTTNMKGEAVTSELIVWDLHNGTPLLYLSGAANLSNKIAITPDGQRLLSLGTDSKLVVWDLRTGSKMRESDLPADTIIYAGSFTPDRNYALLFSKYRNEAVVINVETGAEEFRFSVGEKGIDGLVFKNNDGLMAIIGEIGGHLEVFRLTRATLPGVAFSESVNIQGQGSGVAIASVITPDGTRAVITDSGGGAFVLDMQSGQEIMPLGPLSRGDVQDVAITRDGKKVFWVEAATGIFNGADIETKSQLFAKGAHPNNDALGVVLTDDEREAVTFGSDGNILLWSIIGPRRVLRTMSGHKGPVLDVALTPDDTLAVSVGYDNQVILWDLNSGQQKKVLQGPSRTKPQGVHKVVISPDGNWAVTSSLNGSVDLWNLNDYTKTNYRYGDGRISAEHLAFSSASDQFYVALGGEIWAWPVGPLSGSRLTPGIAAHLSDGIGGLALSSDGQKLVTAGKNRHSVKIWDTRTGKLIAEHEMTQNPLDEVRALHLSSDATKVLISGGAGTGLQAKVLTISGLDTPITHQDDVVGAVNREIRDPKASWRYVLSRMPERRDEIRDLMVSRGLQDLYDQIMSESLQSDNAMKPDKTGGIDLSGALVTLDIDSEEGPLIFSDRSVIHEGSIAGLTPQVISIQPFRLVGEAFSAFK